MRLGTIHHHARLTIVGQQCDQRLTARSRQKGEKPDEPGDEGTIHSQTGKTIEGQEKCLMHPNKKQAECEDSKRTRKRTIKAIDSVKKDAQAEKLTMQRRK